jgi:hypothetical protein
MANQIELTCKGRVTVACLQVIDKVGLGNIRKVMK